MAKKYLQTFNLICVNFLRCANMECECTLNGLFPHLYDDIFRNYSKEVDSIPRLQRVYFINQTLYLPQSVPLVFVKLMANEIATRP